MRFLGAALILTLLAGCAGYVSGGAFASYEENLRLRGWLRTDRRADDVPISADTLTEAFRRTVFRVENEGGLYGQGRVRTEADASLGEDFVPVLRRWDEVVRFSVVAPPSVRPHRLGRVETFAEKLHRLTGQELRQVQEGEKANLWIMFLGSEDIRFFVSEATERGKNRSRDLLERFGRNTTRPCQYSAFWDEASKALAFVVVLIREGLPERLAESCIEEEMAQALGLVYDHPENRPSIFNDDQEFALLTRHDELLLKILYDPRLKPGMTEAEAMPMVARIARELIPDE